MNILPKKSWHVWSIKNIEKVRRDEQQAAEEEEKRQKKIQLAEKEARTDILRSRALEKRIKSDNNDTPIQSEWHNETPAPDAIQKQPEESTDLLTTHINFFTEEEISGKCQGGENKEHEQEKKEEQEKYERQIGYLTYLGQGSSEFEKQKPWYCISSTTTTTADVVKDDKEGTTPDELEKRSKKAILQKKNLQHMDPMNDMRIYLAADKKYHQKKGNESVVIPSKLHNCLLLSEPSSEKRKCEEKSRIHKKKSKKHSKKDNSIDRKHKKSKRNKTRSKSTSSDDDSSKKSEEKKRKLEGLRAERLKREATETARTKHFMASLTQGGLHKDRVMSTEPTVVREQYYNSQFNPHLARNHNTR